MTFLKAGRYNLRVPEADGGLSRGNGDMVQVMISRSWGAPAKKFLQLSRDIQQIKEWDNRMSRKTYRIELKIDLEDDSGHDALVEAAKQYARDFLASATLMQDGRTPACVLMVDDAFYGVEQIDLMNASELLHEVMPKKED